MADIAPRDLDRITMRFARAPSGARLAWARHGAGPPLVRVAHWLTHVEREPRSAVWRPWLARYGRRFSLVRYDECGYGMSDQVGSAADPERAVDDLAAVIEATGEQRVALLGISGAAPIAITYAARNPQRVSHLVLLGVSSQSRASTMGTSCVFTRARAVCSSRCQWPCISPANVGQRSNAKCRSNPGARCMAIHAASTASVQDPAMGSTNGTFPS